MASWAGDYVSTDELRSYVRIPDADDDAQLELAITAASRAIDSATKRQFGCTESDEARYYTAKRNSSGTWSVDIDDLMVSPTEVTFDSAGDSTWASTLTGTVGYPLNAVVKGQPWTRLAVPTSSIQPTGVLGAIRVIAQWGWTDVPGPVKQACLMQASRLLARRDSPYGVAGSPEAGSEVRLLARLDPDVEVSLRGYRRQRWVFA